MCVVIAVHCIKSLRFVLGYIELRKELVALDSEEIPCEGFLNFNMRNDSIFFFLLYKISGYLKRSLFFFVNVW